MKGWFQLGDVVICCIEMLTTAFGKNPFSSFLLLLLFFF